MYLKRKWKDLQVCGDDMHKVGIPTIEIIQFYWSNTLKKSVKEL